MRHYWQHTCDNAQGHSTPDDAGWDTAALVWQFLSFPVLSVIPAVGHCPFVLAVWFGVRPWGACSPLHLSLGTYVGNFQGGRTGHRLTDQNISKLVNASK